MSLPTHSTNNMKSNDLPSRSLFGNYRRRRVLWSIVLLSAVLLFFFAPSSFWEHSRRLTSESKEWLGFKQNNGDPTDSQDPAASPRYSELQALLHMVSSSELRLPLDIDPSQPLSYEIYSNSVDGMDVAWLRAPDADPPIIVFSKTYCPFSKKAKALLQSYDLDPRPKVVEVDLREDANILKAVLTRLTGHSTFPNVFIGGKSYGGADDLTKLHENDELTVILQTSGVLVGKT